MNMMLGIMFCSFFFKTIKQFLATLLETVVCLEMKEALRSVGQAGTARAALMLALTVRLGGT